MRLSNCLEKSKREKIWRKGVNNQLQAKSKAGDNGNE